MGQKHKKQPLNMCDKLEMLPCFDTEKEEYLYENIENFRDFVFENESIKEICYNYLEMIHWTWHYYYHTIVIDNTKSYIYGNAPLLKDVLILYSTFQWRNNFKTKPYAIDSRNNSIALCIAI